MLPLALFLLHLSLLFLSGFTVKQVLVHLPRQLFFLHLLLLLFLLPSLQFFLFFFNLFVEGSLLLKLFTFFFLDPDTARLDLVLEGLEVLVFFFFFPFELEVLSCLSVVSEQEFG